MLKKTSKTIARCISFLLLIVFFFLCLQVALSAYNTYRVYQDANALQMAYAQSERNDWSHGMLDVNADYVGWLTCEETEIDGPVVQGETNDTYLRTDIYGQHSTAGTLFADENVDFEEHGNVIVYGHKMKDDTMFGTLDAYKDQDFFESSGLMRWQDSTGDHYYQPFAVLIVPGDAESKNFIDIRSWCNSQTYDEKLAMLETIKSRSALFLNQQFKTSDNYLFLVTCDYTRTDGRLVVVGREVPVSEVSNNA